MNTSKPGFQILRRDFLVGAAAGLCAAKAVDWSLPFEWSLASLPEGTKLSFAQSGEDVLVGMILAHAGVSEPSYLDIGAFKPILASNTYLLYRQGGRGVLVEPNVDLIPELQRTRPRDVVLNAGIGFTNERTEADYYVMNLPEWNTFDRREAEQRVQTTDGAAFIIKTVRMPLLPVNEVIAEHFGGQAPSFVSIDTEGLDLAILKTLDFQRYRPKVFCVETHGPGMTELNHEVNAYMTANGYYVRAVTIPNTIYCNGGKT